MNMKKYIKQACVIVLCMMLFCTAVIHPFAETIYYFFGYEYTFINNEKVSLYGVEDGMTQLYVPATLNDRAVADIRNRAFMGNTEITSVDFSTALNLERIGSFAFNNCENLSGEIYLPPNISIIETAAFQNCTSITSVVYDASVPTVPNQCFNGCTSLSSVTLNENVTGIGHYAFTSCPNLSYLEIPRSVTEISDYAFMNDSNLTLGVYYDTAAYHYAIDKGMSYVVLDPENIPVVPTEPVTEPTEAPTEPVTETPEPTQPVTEQPTEALKLLLGDADGDGMVDVTDATVIQRVLNYIDVSSYNENAADADRSGEVEIIDATYIMRYAALLNVAYPIGEWITQ